MSLLSPIPLTRIHHMNRRYPKYSFMTNSISKTCTVIYKHFRIIRDFHDNTVRLEIIDGIPGKEKR